MTALYPWPIPFMAQNGLALSLAAMSLLWRPEPAAFALFLLAPALIIAYWRAAEAV